MKQVSFLTKKGASLDGREYIEVNEQTMELLKVAGLDGRDVYKQENFYNFVGHICDDQMAIDTLKSLLPKGDHKPMFFKLADNIGSVMYYESKFKGQVFGGQNWTGALTDLGDAWLVVVTNSHR